MTVPGEHLADVIERNRADERRRALRALLICPLLPSTHPAYPLVRRHAEVLRPWLAREAGWELVVEDDFARLRKRAADHRDATRGARPDTPPGAPPFSRRRYALLCLALADLERGESQVTLGRLGEALMRGAADPALEAQGLRFALAHRDERRDLVAVARLLLSLGVLGRVAGDEESFVGNADRDVLYDVNRRVLSTLLVVARGPSLAERGLAPGADLDARIEAVTAEFVSDTPEGRNAALRRRLGARLLDDPVLYHEELEPEAREYLASQRPHIARRIEEMTGLVAEVRAEGMAMVDPAGNLSDEQLPSEGTEGHATLLLADFLAGQRGAVPVAELHARMRGWIRQYRRYWRRAVQEPGAEAALAEQAVDRLCALRLAVREAGGVRPLPAIGRHALGHHPRLAGEGAEAP